MVVSKGSQFIPVPSVVGMTTDEATSTLETAGFEVETREQFGVTVANRVISPGPVGRVAGQSRDIDHPDDHLGHPPAGRSSPSAPASSQTEGLTQFLEPLGDLEGQFQTLHAVQPRVAGSLVAIRQESRSCGPSIPPRHSVTSSPVSSMCSHRGECPESGEPRRTRGPRRSRPRTGGS